MFDRALAFVLAREGGKVDDPQDRGGRTNQGVTQRVYDAYRKRQGLDHRDVWEIGSEEVAAIYRAGYWEAVDGDTLCAASPELALATFDCAVNSGAGRAIKQLQTALGVTADGSFGPKSREALLLAATKGYPRVLADMLAQRDAFYEGIVRRDPSQQKYIRGWHDRVNKLRRACGLPEEER